MNQKPMFIVLEGIDGSGTTTQAARLAERLERLGRKVHLTCEPSKGPVGQLLRQLLRGEHSPQPGESVDGRTMALLFAADRIDHLQREVELKLAAGYDVISDRYYLSSLAYQKIEADDRWVASLAKGIRSANLTLLLEVSVEVAAQRRQKDNRKTERYDANSYLSQVARNYHKLAIEHGAHIVDANAGLNDVEAAIGSIVEKAISRFQDSAIWWL